MVYLDARNVGQLRKKHELGTSMKKKNEYDVMVICKIRFKYEEEK